MLHFTSFIPATQLYTTMQRDKSHLSGPRTVRSADPEASQRATRGSNHETTTLGSKGKKTASTLKESRNTLNNPAAARKWLAKEELLIDGEDVTLASLAQALLWVAAGERNTVEQLVDAIRAVALCLEECEGREVVESAIIEIKQSAVLWAEEAKGMLQKATDEIVEEAKKKVNEGVKKSWAERMDDEDELGIPNQSQAGRSYAHAVAKGRGKSSQCGLSQVDHDFMASKELKRRKVLIDGIEGLGNAAGGLNAREIVEKANIALTAARLGTEGNGMEPSIDPKAVAAKVLENGGVVLELETEEAVEWLTIPEVRKAFEENFGGSAKLVDQQFHVVVSFLPVTLRDTLEVVIPKVELDNDIPPGTIVRTKWLKSPKYWKDGQRFAHGVLSFINRIDASTVIRKGIVVEGQRFKAKKLEELPRRCFKCQRIGHLANNCREISVICPNCAGAHEGSSCTVSADKLRCINCSKAGQPANHAAWDWGCASMEEAKRRRGKRNPDSQYRFFPTNEDWTWAKRDIHSDEEAQGTKKDWGRASREGYEERRADKGWKGMRDLRAAGIVAGEAEGWAQVGARGSSRHTGTQGPTHTNRNPTRTLTGSNDIPVQLTGQPSSQRSTFRHGPIESGRQSKLGDYWTGRRDEGDDDLGGQIENNPFEADLC